MIRIEDIEEKASEYLHPNDPDLTEQDRLLIRQAFLFAARAHANQTRRSGEPYLSHPLEVAYILTELTIDAVGISAGLLHDVVEDTHHTIDDIKEIFGAEIATIVDALTKLDQMNFHDKKEAKAANIVRLVRSGAIDDRVITVKLADRLHNMRTLEAQKPEKQKEIAKETEFFFVPLAIYMGLHGIKNELGALSLRYLEPELYHYIDEGIKKQKEEKSAYIHQVIGELNALLQAHNIKGRATGRIKHLYGIYHRMRNQNIKLDQMHDVLGFRVIVWAVPDCYTVMKLIHERFPQVGRMKDYIMAPKPSNNYQSLHTTVIGPESRRIELQIRTEAMHEVAELGISAHYFYKGNLAERVKVRIWLQDINKPQADSQDNEDILATLADMSKPEIIVFTPKGKKLTLPSGATVVDFAYSIHTDIGNQCVGARVNGQPVALNTRLQDDDRVNILTDKEAHPQTDWRNFVQTNKARVRIEKWLRKNEKHNKPPDMGEKITGSDQSQPFAAMLHIICQNHKGVLAAIAATLAEEDINIEKGHFKAEANQTSDMVFIVIVRDTGHLNGAIEKLNQLNSVSMVRRMDIQESPRSFSPEITDIPVMPFFATQTEKYKD